MQVSSIEKNIIVIFLLHKDFNSSVIYYLGETCGQMVGMNGLVYEVKGSIRWVTNEIFPCSNRP